MANLISEPSITIGVQGGQGTTLYAQWLWTKKYTKEYEYQWQYHTGVESIWYEGNSGTTTLKNTTYSYPENAKKVRFRVKPISKTTTKNKKTVNRWTASYSNWKTYTIKQEVNKTPATPSSSPNLSLNGLELTIQIDNITDPNTKTVQIDVLQDHRTLFISPYVSVTNGYVSYKCTLNSGHEYSVRYRGVNIQLFQIVLGTTSGFEEYFGEYSEYVSIGTAPAPIPGTIKINAVTEASVTISWDASTMATSYEIEYATDPNHFDTSANVNTMTVEGKTSVAIEGLSSGTSWYFRIRAVNSNGSSAWSGVVSTVIGTTPTAPTTWQTSTRAISGEPVIIHWVHNNEDGSDVQGVTISYNINNGSQQDLVWTIEQDDSNNDFKEGRFTFDTDNMKDNTIVNWCVRTKGLLPAPKDWGPYSVTRSFSVFEKPRVFLQIYREKKWYWNPFNFTIDSIYTAKGDLVGIYNDPIVIDRYPFFLVITTQPENQYPLDFNISITALKQYQTIDDIGEIRNVNEGEVIYSKSDVFNYEQHSKEVVFMPFDADLENGASYKLTCTVAFDSGLSAEGILTFSVAFESLGDYDVNAETMFDDENLSMYIQPYCRYESEDEEVEGDLVGGVRLSVYRRTFDGKFIEIAKDLQNTNRVAVTDLHPELKYARYRIVIMSSKTGMVDFYDLPSYPILYPSMVIQWDERWRNFNADEAEEDAFADPLQSGTMLTLPYNIDISDQTSPDVEKVEYIGREFPVAYYGTQIGQTTSYSTDIPANDNDRMLAIRKLMRWMGDVYLRDPSGIGYWANVSVSYSHTHNEVHTPISINATRVEGGM